MVRRNYQAWSYSPLERSTANVKDCGWRGSWAMNEGGANQPMPLVHDGIIYLANTGNIVQALDARDRRSDLGEPVGRTPPSYRARCATSPSTRTRFTSRPPMRGWSRSTPRTGRWSGTRRSPINQGFSNTSGPIVVRGR